MVQPLSFSAKARIPSLVADLTALFGPSGSRKTTVINWIAGLDRRNTGHIRMHRTACSTMPGALALPLKNGGWEPELPGPLEVEAGGTFPPAPS